MMDPMFILILSVLTVAVGAALVFYRKVRLIRRTEKVLARILGAEEFQKDLQTGVRELRDLAEASGSGLLAEVTNATANLVECLSESMPVYSEYRGGRILPPSFVLRTLGPDGILRGLGRAEGPGFEAAGYAAWLSRSEWMDFYAPNRRYAWFAHLWVPGRRMESALICRIAASLIRTEFENRETSLHRPETLPDILYRINEYVESLKFECNFVVACLGLWDRQDKEAVLCGAGIPRLNRWSTATHSLMDVELSNSSPIGNFSNLMIETKAPFKPTKVKLDPGDMLFFCNDTNHSIRYIRDETGRILVENVVVSIGETETIHEQQLYEHFDSDQRIVSLLEAIGRRLTWRLEKKGCLPEEKDLVFDFSTCEGGPKDFALALAAAERIFRMYPDPGAKPGDQVYMDPETDEFLVQHFSRVGLYRKDGMVRILEGAELKQEYGGGFQDNPKVVVWGGVREDRPCDISVLAIKNEIK